MIEMIIAGDLGPGGLRSRSRIGCLTPLITVDGLTRPGSFMTREGRRQKEHFLRRLFPEF